MSYRELSEEELETLSADDVATVQAQRAQAHAAWHEQFSGEYDDCPFQYLGEDFLTSRERAVLKGRGLV